MRKQIYLSEIFKKRFYQPQPRLVDIVIPFFPHFPEILVPMGSLGFPAMTHLLSPDYPVTLSFYHIFTKSASLLIKRLPPAAKPVKAFSATSFFFLSLTLHVPPYTYPRHPLI